MNPREDRAVRMLRRASRGRRFSRLRILGSRSAGSVRTARSPVARVLSPVVGPVPAGGYADPVDGGRWGGG